MRGVGIVWLESLIKLDMPVLCIETKEQL